MIYCDIYEHMCMGFICSADNNKDKVKCPHAKVQGDKENRLKVMPDFSSTGIWDLSTGVSIDFKYLLLDNNELSDEFEKWIKYYDICFEDDFTTFKPNMSDKLNKWGRELALKLKKVLEGTGTGEWEIVYHGEGETGMLEKEIISET